jgi:hypothetical protein
VGIDQNTDHAESAVVFDESHASHVAGKVEDRITAFDRFVTGVFLLQIENMILGGIMFLIPLIERFDISDHYLMTSFEEDTCELASNESAATGD